MEVGLLWERRRMRVGDQHKQGIWNCSWNSRPHNSLSMHDFCLIVLQVKRVRSHQKDPFHSTIVGL